MAGETITPNGNPEMRAELVRMLADAPTQEQVMAGLRRVTDSLIKLAETTVRKARYADSGAAHELEFYGSER